METFLAQPEAHVALSEKKLNVQAYSIREIWSIDVAYMDKIAKYNNGVRYMLVEVDVLSNFLRVEPIKTNQKCGRFNKSFLQNDAKIHFRIGIPSGQTNYQSLKEKSSSFAI